MPLHIIRQDITKIKCDAIVNPTNSKLNPGGGIDLKIHEAAGSQFADKCKEIKNLEVGKSTITLAYNLPCKYVIHTVGPVWKGGEFNEPTLLQSCYENSLKLAKQYNCETVAFPLISSGTHNYPKNKVLSVAVNSISKFLFDNEMTVFIVVYDNESFTLSEKLFTDVKEYIDDNYVINCYEERSLNNNRSIRRREQYLIKSNSSTKSVEKNTLSALSHKISLEDMLSAIDDNFALTLMKLIDLKGLTDVECYKKANVSKQTWYKILNDKNYKPSKNTVISFAIALKLSLQETNHLLSTVGFVLSKSNPFDIIIEYFIKSGEYNIFEINQTLFKFNQPCLGV